VLAAKSDVLAEKEVLAFEVDDRLDAEVRARVEAEVVAARLVEPARDVDVADSRVFEDAEISRAE